MNPKPRNGYVPNDELTTVQGFPGAKDTAAIVERIHNDSGGKVVLAQGAPFYRSFFVQGDMHVHPALYNLDHGSSIRLAAAGSSSHGFGDRFDVSTNNGGRDWMIANGPKYGLVREFGAADPGHWMNPHETWPGIPAASTPASGLSLEQAHLVGTYLNSRAASVGQHTTDAGDHDAWRGTGVVGPNYWTLVQALGAADGLYPQPAYKIDGKPGPKTLSIEVHYLAIAQGADGTPPITAPTPPPAPAPAPAPAAESDEDMVRRIARYLNGRVLGNDSSAASNGVRGPVYWMEIQRAGRQDGLYGAGYVIDGKPGPKSRELEQHYSQVAPH